jgi:hypothetical protein
MSPEQPDAVVLDYIRANRGTYTREAIRRALLEAGHDEVAIDAAWAELDHEQPPATIEAAPPGGVASPTTAAVPPPASPSAVRLAMRTLLFWAVLVGFLLGYIVLSAILAALSNDQTAGIVGLTITAIPQLALVAGIALAIPGRTRPAGLGLLGALVVLVGLMILLAILAFIAVVIIFGICVVAISRGTTP